MKKYFKYLFVVCFALIMSVGVALAASLAVTSIGGVTTSGTGNIFETTKTSPTIIGTAAADATVDITIDDLIVAAIADADGDWSYTPTSLTLGDHLVEIASNLETVSFTLTISSGSSTTEESSSSSSSKGGVSTSSAELPEAGVVENTVLVIAAGMFLMGLGIITHQKLPVPEGE